MSENGTIHITIMKIRVSHILFLRKGGLIDRIPGSAEKGVLFGTDIGTVPYIGSYPPPPPSEDYFQN